MEKPNRKTEKHIHEKEKEKGADITARPPNK